MSTGKIALGALAGLAIGVIAGILIAPEKGSTTRNQIIDKGNDYVDEMKTMFDEFRDSLAKIIESTKTDAENLTKS